jgi:hypothetical protein
MSRCCEVGITNRRSLGLHFGTVGFKTVRGSTFGVSPASIYVEVWSAEESSACCGVNLAVAGFGFFFLLLGCQAVSRWLSWR